ncbi:hypothetical protein FACS189473_5150 [Spirochaetia bacterium]|nr:hypothetical protein FACS189473_5150 [Spirochaetia bacterium]
MIEKIAWALRIEPYHFFIDRAAPVGAESEPDIYPRLPNSMKDDIKSQVSSSVAAILEHY